MTGFSVSLKSLCHVDKRSWDPQTLSQHPGSIHWYETPDTYKAEDCLVWPQWEKMCLTLERLQAPGSGEVWGWDILLEMREEEWNEELLEADLEGYNDWTVKKRVKFKTRRGTMTEENHMVRKEHTQKNVWVSPHSEQDEQVPSCLIIWM